MLQFDKLAWCCAHCSRLEHRWWDEFAAECVGSWSRIFEFDFHLTFRRDLFFFPSFVVCFVVLCKWILLFFWLRVSAHQVAIWQVQDTEQKKQKQRKISFRQYMVAGAPSHLQSAFNLNLNRSSRCSLLLFFLPFSIFVGLRALYIFSTKF